MNMTTKQINDGGPAFPRTEDGEPNPQLGMTLRDYFAGQAMAACITLVTTKGLGDEMLKLLGLTGDATIMEASVALAEAHAEIAIARRAAREGGAA